jgi:ankyrin repeat protein
MHRSIPSWPWVLLACSLALSAQSPARAEADEHRGIRDIRISNAAAAVVVPLLDGRRSPLIECSVNGRLTRLGVDTGWSPSALDRRTADRFRVPRLGLVITPLWENTAGSVARRRIDEARVGDLEFVAPWLPDYDFLPLSRTMNVRYGGMLGFDALRHAPVTFDFTAGTLTFHDPERFAPPPEAIRVPFEREDLMPFVRINVGGVDAVALIDTGSSDAALSLRPKFVTAHPSIVSEEIVGYDDVIGLSGTRTRVEVRRCDLEIFGQKRTGDLATVGLSDTASQGFDAIVGMHVLRDFRLTFDAARGCLWTELVPYPSIADQLAAGLDVGAVDVFGIPPLHHAVSERDEASVEAALALGADPGQANSRSGMLPVHLAASTGEVAILRRLIERGADVNATMPPDDMRPLHAAASEGHTGAVEVLLRAGAKADARMRDGMTPLLYAARFGHLAIARLLVDGGADTIARTNEHRSAILFAAMSDSPEMIEWLAARGGDVRGTDRLGFGMLHNAAAVGANNSVRYLIEKHGLVDTAGRDGFTPLVAAAKGGFEDTARLLLDAGASPDPPLARQNGSVLLLSVRSFSAEFIASLVERGVSTNAVDSQNRTALHVALEHWRETDIIRALIDAGCELDRADHNNLTPLLIAASARRFDVVEALLDAGCGVDDANADGLTAVCAAATWGRLEVLELLLDRGAGVDAAQSGGLQPVACAAVGGHADAIRMLIDRSAAIDTADHEGQTPLMAAAQGGHAGCIRLLLELGARLDAVDSSGDAPIHHAAKRGHSDAVRTLVTAGADIDMPGANRATPLLCAVIGFQAHTVEVLLELGADPRAEARDAITAITAARQLRDARIERTLLAALEK